MEHKITQVLQSVFTLQEQQTKVQNYDDQPILKLIESLEENIQAHSMRLKSFDDKFNHFKHGINGAWGEGFSNAFERGNGVGKFSY